MLRVNGLAHIQLTVSDMDRSMPFYERLLHFLDMKTIFRGPEFFYCVGSRTGVAITPAAPEFRDELFHQRRVGLHHFCFRARSREDVDAIHGLAVELGAAIVHAPQEDARFAPGYYSVLFEDPDGIRIEASHVPGKGNLDPRVTLPLYDAFTEES